MKEFFYKMFQYLIKAMKIAFWFIAPPALLFYLIVDLSKFVVLEPVGLVVFAKGFLEYLKVLAWPIVVVVVFLSLREKLKDLIGKVCNLHWGSVGLTISQDSSGNEAKVKKSEAEIVKDLPNIEDATAKLGEMTSSLEETKKDLLAARIQLDFERIYRVIFGSQIALIKNLIGKPSGVNRNFIEAIFQETQKSYSDILGKWSLDGYLGYLITNRLIEFDGLNYKSTNKGFSFIEYITNMGYEQNKGL